MSEKPRPVDGAKLLELAGKPLVLRDCAECGSDDITSDSPDDTGRWSIQCLDCGRRIRARIWIVACWKWGITLRARALSPQPGDDHDR